MVSEALPLSYGVAVIQVVTVQHFLKTSKLILPANPHRLMGAALKVTLTLHSNPHTLRKLNIDIIVKKEMRSKELQVML